MGGTLYLNDGQAAGRGNVCISGYQSGKPNFALSNFHKGPGGNGYTFQDPHIGQVTFPTAEHYLHFQKLSPAAKTANVAAWQAEQSPGEILKGIRNSSSKFHIPLKDYSDKIKSGGSFDPQKWDAFSPEVQMQINVTKYQQSKEFRDSIQQSIDMGKAFGDGKGAATIIEDTASALREETNWGIGQDGKGTNWLGNSQTAFANRVQKEFQVPPVGTLPTLGSVQNPVMAAAYQAATTQYQQGIQKSLQIVRPVKSKTDTSDLGPGTVQQVTPQQVGLKQVPSFQAGAPTSSKSAGLPPITQKGTLLSVKPDAKFPIDLQFDKSGKLVRAFWERSPGKWDEMKGAGLQKQWVKDAIKAADQSIQEHIAPSAQPVHQASPSQSRYQGPPVTDTFVKDGNPKNITLVVRAGGGHHFSQRTGPKTFQAVQLADTHPVAAGLLQQAMSQGLLPRGKPASKSSHAPQRGPQASTTVSPVQVRFNGMSGSGNEFFYKDDKAGITCVLDKKGGHHFSDAQRQRVNPTRLPPGYSQALLKAAKQSKRSYDVTMRQQRSAQSHQYGPPRQTFHQSPHHQAVPQSPGLRKPDPKPIRIPEVVGENSNGSNRSFSINRVKAAYHDQGPFSEAIKLTFEDPANLKIALESLEEVVGSGNVRIEPATSETGNLPCLSFHGSATEFTDAVSRVEKIDQERYGAGTGPDDFESEEDDLSRGWRPGSGGNW